MAKPLLIGKSGDLEMVLLPGMANRHGVITGATGTGKTVTIQAMIERFSDVGTPVFMADVKGRDSRCAAPSPKRDRCCWPGC